MRLEQQPAQWQPAQLVELNVSGTYNKFVGTMHDLCNFPIGLHQCSKKTLLHSKKERVYDIMFAQRARFMNYELISAPCPVHHMGVCLLLHQSSFKLDDYA